MSAFPFNSVSSNQNYSSPNSENLQSLNSLESDFLSAMQSAGLDYSGAIIADGALHRISVNGDRATNSFYVLHPDGIPAGHFGCWKRNIRENWCAVSNEALTEEQRAERDRHWREAQQAREADKKRQNDEAAVKAQAILDRAQDAPDDHPYLVRKGVKAYPGVKIGAWSQAERDQCLLIPLRTADGLLATLQAVFPQKSSPGGRDKDFLKGGKKSGAYFVIGDLHTADTVIISEGYATAATLHEAMGYPSVMAIDAGNLKPVATILKALYPRKQFIIAGDNDRFTDGNPGVAKATAAAKAISAVLAIPHFADDEAGSDFNDLMLAHGLEVVKTAIEAATISNADKALAAVSPKNEGAGNTQPIRNLKILGHFNGNDLCCVATNLASAESIHQWTELPVVVAGNSQGLRAAAQHIRAAYPKLKLLVCGDNCDSTLAGQARIAAFSLVGGSYFCVPNFLKPSESEVIEAAKKLMGASYKEGDPIHPRYIEAAEKELLTADQELVKEESPSTFADLVSLWEKGNERLAEQVKAGIANIGVIRIRAGKLASIVSQAEKEVLFYGAELYQRVGMLVRPVKQDVQLSSSDKNVRVPVGALVLTAVNRAWLNRRFNQSAKWVKFDKDRKDWIPADPPTKYADTLLAMSGEWRAPVLTGIVECPTLRPDGSLLTQSGYDAASGLYVDYRGEPVNVPEQPTQSAAMAALETLKAPFAEFPFTEGDIDLSVVLAGSLTAVVRRSIRTAPLTAIDAPAMGAGKGLIVNTISTIVTGRAAPAISQGKDETEDEKRLGALLLQGVPLLNIDNIERELQGDLLCSALTETTIAIRILGRSEVMYMPSNVAMFATGNNLRARGDMVRRMLVCRIDPACERPDARSFSLNLNEYVPAHRAELLTAALTVLRAYIVAGKPKQDIPPYGSFEEWSGLIRSALVWLGMPDPCLTRSRLEADDAVTIHLHSILTLWFSAFGNRGMTASEVSTQAGLPGNADIHTALLEVAASRRDPEKIDSLRLGHWLKRNKGKVANRLRLEKAGEDTDKKIVYWRVASLQPTQFTGITGITGIDPMHSRKNRESTQSEGESDFSRGLAETIPVNPRNTRNSIPPDDLPPVDSPEEDAHTLANYLQSSDPLDTTTLRERLNWDESRWIAAKNEAVAGGKVYCTGGLWEVVK